MHFGCQGGKQIPSYQGGRENPAHFGCQGGKEKPAYLGSQGGKELLCILAVREVSKYLHIKDEAGKILRFLAVREVRKNLHFWALREAKNYCAFWLSGR